MLQLHISETIELNDLGQVIVLCSCIHMKIDLLVVSVVVVNYRSQNGLQLEVSPIIQLKVCKGVHYPTLYAHSVHLDRMLAQLRSHY